MRKTKDGRARRGQLFSGDITIATFVFLSALTVAFGLWNATTTDINNAEELWNMQKLSSESLEALIRTPGIPEDWNYWTVVRPGLASEDRVINYTKAADFIYLMRSDNSSNYDNNRHTMGLGEYHFFFNATTEEGSQIYVGNEPFVAGEPIYGETQNIGIYRSAIYNETIIKVNFIIWR
jgi:hypothetical protein